MAATRFLKPLLCTIFLVTALAAGCADEPWSGSDANEETASEADREAQLRDEAETARAEGEAARTAAKLEKASRGFLPHNQTISLRASNGCTYGYQHGNYLGAAYAKAIMTNGCDALVTVVALRNGSLTEANAYVPVTGGWRQAQVNLASIVGSDLFIVNPFGEAVLEVFAGVR